MCTQDGASALRAGELHGGSTTINTCIIYWEGVARAAGERQRTQNKPETSMWQQQRGISSEWANPGLCPATLSPHLCWCHLRTPSSGRQTSVSLQGCPGEQSSPDNIEHSGPSPFNPELTFLKCNKGGAWSSASSPRASQNRSFLCISHTSRLFFSAFSPL